MNLRYLLATIAVTLSILTISACQTGPSYNSRPVDGGNSYGSNGGYGSGGGSGSSGY